MTPGGRLSLVCERFHAQMSLDLDGELSQLERAMLAAHLSRCAACRAFREEVAGVADTVRAARLERLSAPVTVRRTRRLITARLQAAAAAAVALVVVGVSGQLANQPSRDGGSSGLGGEGVVRFPTQDELEEELALIGTTHPEEQPPRAGGATIR